MSIDDKQYLRRANLIVSNQDIGIDLSEMHFKFRVSAADVQSPNNAFIRVYNLAEDTVKKVIGEYDTVTLQAGYENSTYGIIFTGTIKQFKRGRENATDSYLDILAADGDIGYNFGIVNQTISKENNTPQNQLNIAAKAMGVDIGFLGAEIGGIKPNPRGKVAFGLARNMARNVANTVSSTWSIQDGRINVIPLTGYLPGEAVVLSSLTGVIGIPEQTDEGIKVRCLLNPKIIVGGLVQIDNSSINQIIQQNPNAAPIPFNQRTGIQFLAKTSSDGFYRVYVVEHEGDTRGQQWYSDLICLTVDASSNQVKAYG